MPAGKARDTGRSAGDASPVECRRAQSRSAERPKACRSLGPDVGAADGRRPDYPARCILRFPVGRAPPGEAAGSSPLAGRARLRFDPGTDTSESFRAVDRRAAAHSLIPEPPKLLDGVVAARSPELPLAQRLADDFARAGIFSAIDGPADHSRHFRRERYAELLDIRSHRHLQRIRWQFIPPLQTGLSGQFSSPHWRLLVR